jgi:WD40 repeat protein
MVYAVDYSPDGRLLATGSFDERIRLFAAPHGAYRYAIEGHRNLVTALSFSPDGRRLASGSHDDNVMIWRMPDGILERTLEERRP